jgi:hypothetical protein
MLGKNVELLPGFSIARLHGISNIMDTGRHTNEWNDDAMTHLDALTAESSRSECSVRFSQVSSSAQVAAANDP